MQVVIAEKPSVARDIARVLGANRRAKGYLHGAGYAVTWALGHLVTLPEPHQIDPSWKRWTKGALPMLPRAWPLVVIEGTADQYAVVERLLNRSDTEAVVCATDAGREGELIFRYIMERAGCDKPVRRLWISSLTPQAIERGFARLQSGHDYDHLAAAASARSRADWLVGMNLSRAYTLAMDDNLSVGRVQTPTLAMIVERDQAIAAFVPEDYLELWVRLPRASNPEPAERDLPKAQTFEARYVGDDLNLAGKAPPKGAGSPLRLPPDGERAAALRARVTGQSLCLARADAVPRSQKPPLLYDLTDLQRHANRVFGWSAQRTLSVAQSLYERHKLISYPRTDSRHLSRDVAAQLPGIVAAVAAPYAALVPDDIGKAPLGRRYVDDAKVTDHHAIIPTGVTAKLSAGSDEGRLYDLICRRLLSAFMPDHRYVDSLQFWVHGDDGERARPCFVARGKVVKEEGFRKLEALGRKRPSAPPSPPSLPDAALSERRTVVAAGVDEKQTQPPRPYDEGTLLTAMETAGRTLDDKQLSDAMRERGLGTPATRAAIIENLLGRGYLERQGKALRTTGKGQDLIAAVHEEVRSPAMTGDWEHQLKLIERGERQLPTFVAAIEAYVSKVICDVFEDAPPARRARPEPPPSSTGRADPQAGAGMKAGAKAAGGRAKPVSSRAAKSPPASLTRADAPALPEADLPPRPPIVTSVDQPGADPGALLAKNLEHVFGHGAFRAHQRAVCERLVEGESVLLVMPTGAGKSLCYQLPGVTRGGVTVVVSPLIALMDDQVQKLRAQGLRAERIHSGLSRTHSRAVCRAYRAGELDFLFLAPERLAVPGFGPFLAAGPMSLIAIDEAHCISQWGHDFRPDYRMLNERLLSLPGVQGVPVVALTATATEAVQDDIESQLGAANPHRSVHGFRRDNLAIEAVELPPAARAGAAARLLSDPARRPAILYAATRKQADETARVLTQPDAGGLSAAAYHAGMQADARFRVQRAFLAGELEVVVATTAFGMGIDKPDVRTVLHLALPGTLEGYYQEIGRAGRDGAPARAVLLHSAGDRRTHEFFFERDYPSAAQLTRLFRKLTETPQPASALAQALAWDGDKLALTLDRLWAHGGALLDDERRATRGDGGYRARYLAHRKHAQDQLERVVDYAEASSCRMLRLLSHFGDRADSGVPCGQCDRCRPEGVVLSAFRAPSASEAGHLVAMLAHVERAREPGPGLGELFRSTMEDTCARDAFDVLVDALCRAGITVRLADSFTKAGRRIAFERLTPGPEWGTVDRGDGGELATFVQVPVDLDLGASPPAARAARRPATRPRRRRAVKTRRRR